MLDQDDLLLMDELPIDEPEPLDAIPEVRHYLEPERWEGEVGLRSILERPEALSKAWRRHALARKRTRRAKRRRATMRGGA
jgi:hypothetical protein